MGSNQTPAQPGAPALIPPREADIGGMVVRRSLPAGAVRSIGPWVFFDHMGPATLGRGRGLDVVPHPHVNLATVTYLFQGEIEHRDSIGSRQRITPGAINLMIAGSGIAHSERTPLDLRNVETTAHGLQLWMALPEDHEEMAPEFLHYEAATLPSVHSSGATIRVLMGEGFGLSSPVKTLSPALYGELVMTEGSAVRTPPGISELGIYLVHGRAAVGKVTIDRPGMVAIRESGPITVKAEAHSRLVIIGGEPLGKRYIWWNFVSSRRQRIEQAKTAWANREFPPIPGDGKERAELPATDGHSVMEE